MKRYNTNKFIKAGELRVVDEEGKNLGVFSLSQALALAQKEGLDLIEINPKAQPPVAKICDFGKFIYAQKKEERKQRVKQRKDELKKIRLTFKMGANDQEIRAKQANKFLTQGLKVQLELFMKGREKGKADLARKKLEDFLSSLSVEYKIASQIQKTPRSIFVVISK